MDWYSVSLRVVCSIRGEVVECWEPVHVLRASSFADARVKAIELGRGYEQMYVNGEGDEVRWTFLQVLTSDQLGPTIEDGREVWCSVRQPLTEAEAQALLGDAPVDPEESHPGQTGV